MIDVLSMLLAGRDVVYDEGQELGVDSATFWTTSSSLPLYPCYVCLRDRFWRNRPPSQRRDMSSSGGIQIQTTLFFLPSATPLLTGLSSLTLAKIEESASPPSSCSTRSQHEFGRKQLLHSWMVGDHVLQPSVHDQRDRFLDRSKRWRRGLLWFNGFFESLGKFEQVETNQGEQVVVRYH
jgi:hypothetical protein